MINVESEIEGVVEYMHESNSEYSEKRCRC